MKKAVSSGVFWIWMAIGLCVAQMSAAADRAKIEEFLITTGFDVALDSIRLGAESAPNMLGLDADDFGAQWVHMTGKVFKTDIMHGLALDILEQTLTPDLLNHAADFYSSDLGLRLVAAENASHMEEDEGSKSEAGEAIIAALVRHGSPRVESLNRMNAAIGSTDSAVRAIQEIQVRFLLAAAGAGVIELTLEEPDLREMLSEQAATLRTTILASSLSGAAYTYQAFSDEEVEAYAVALENPLMRRVYELMNAVQFEITANRFEALAVEMAKLQPSTDL